MLEGDRDELVDAVRHQADDMRAFGLLLAAAAIGAVLAVLYAVAVAIL